VSCGDLCGVERSVEGVAVDVGHDAIAEGPVLVTRSTTRIGAADPQRCDLQH
jgi:hypothetical protein